MLLAAGALGFAAAAVLSVERARLLGDPAYLPVCDLGGVLSCGAVMTSPQAAAFGVPNTSLGLAGFPLVAAGGVLALGGVSLLRPWRLAFLGGVVAAAGFVCWLVFQSLYRIGALCPYCLVVWAVVPLALVGAARWCGAPRAVWLLAPTWYVVVAALVLARFA